MECPTCSSFAPDGSRFCPSCGRGLTVSAALTPASTPNSETVELETRAGTSEGLDAIHFGAGDFVAGRYRMIRELGRGGMGAVYLADDTRLGQAVALKFLPPALAHDARRLTQFQNEVSISRQITHPNVCRVYDIGDVEGHLFLSMEYIDGEDLAATLKRRGAFAEQDAVDLIRQICAGLSAVHARGILHRDLKPANVMLDGNGNAKLMDFGIATSAGVASAREGTPAYMAPEQLLGEPVTTQSDLYALGLVMHEIFTARRVFDSASVADLVTHHTGGGPAPTSLSVISSSRLQQAVVQCLEREPSRRPASAQAVAALLQTVLLDTRTVWRRLAQTALLFSGPLLIAIAVAAVRRSEALAGLGLAALGVFLLVAGLRSPFGWTVLYKGHEIRFQLHPIWGERLYIDGVLADRGRIGVNVTMRGTIEAGAGAGERITAQSRAQLFSVSCRIVAESFAGATP